MAFRLRVDWIKCDGYGLCGDYAPDLIDLDEWRYPILRPGPIDGRSLHDAARAVDCCPKHALSMVTIEDERAGQDRGSSSRQPPARGEGPRGEVRSIGEAARTRGRA